MPADANDGQDDNAYFSIDNEGRLTLTALGISEYRSHFGKAGIDIREIKTLDGYYRARNAASPYFEEFLVSKFKDKEKTLERRLLIAVAEGDDDEAMRLGRLLDARNKGFGLV